MPSQQLEFDFLGTTIPQASWDLSQLFSVSSSLVQGSVGGVEVILDIDEKFAVSECSFKVEFSEESTGKNIAFIDLFVQAKYKMNIEIDQNGEEVSQEIFKDSINFIAAEVASEVARIAKSAGLRTPLAIDAKIISDQLGTGVLTSIDKDSQ